jgi:putative protein-disulfide isomerase
MAQDDMGDQHPAQMPGGNQPALEIACFTDPLCCWSWAYEPQLRRLRHGFAGRIAWRLRMGGMIGDWESFNDPLNDVHRPAQMGPLWLQAAGISGMPFEPAIWVNDPPASSWPACLAVCAAGLQSPAAADLFLRAVRSAVMTQQRNVAREDVLLEVAREVEARRRDLFSAEGFRNDHRGRAARAALDDDVRETRYHRIGRFPCLRLARQGADPVWLVGWRPWDALIDAVRRYAPDLGPERRPTQAGAYEAYWGGVTQAELALALAHGATGDHADDFSTLSSGVISIVF